MLANLHRAGRPGDLPSLTVQELQQHHLGHAFASLSARRLPAVWGELAEPDAPGYHYYPGRGQALGWFGQQDPAIADEGFRRETGGAAATSCCAPARLRQHHDTAWSRSPRSAVTPWHPGSLVARLAGGVRAGAPGWSARTALRTLAAPWAGSRQRTGTVFRES